MTKVRPPASFEDALTRIAALIGWDGCQAVLNANGRMVAGRTIRNWSDPDTLASIPVRDALTLDLAYKAAGGVGTPLFDAYALQLELETEQARLNPLCLIRMTSVAAKESGEALAAMALASSPHASPNDKARAAAEIQEAIDALSKGLVALGMTQKCTEQEAA